MEIKLLSCPLCSNPHFNGVDTLRTTLVTVATKLVSCPVCPETLLGLDKLTIHLFSHIDQQDFQEEIDRSIEDASKNAPQVEAVKCDICNFSFDDRNILEMHQKLLHQTPPDQKTGTYNYHCHLCSKQFRMRGSLMVHLRVAHYGYGREEGAVRVEDSGGAEKGGEEKMQQKSVVAKVIDNKQWECDVCFKMFTTKYFLKKHKRLHTGEMPYCCNLCNKSFTFQQSYHKHMQYHSSEKPHVCTECGRAFKELSTLQNHSRIHSGERPFVCESCGKSFRQRVSYLVHRRIHTGAMPYKCTACDKSFRYKVSQKSHKCPVNPPGSVVFVPEQNSGRNSPQNSNKCVMNVDLDTGNIRVEPQGSLVQKKSIVINGNECIEISYKQADLQNAIQEEKHVLPIKEVAQNLMDNVQKHDPFTVTLSNILPEVESLYLHGSPTNNNLDGQGNMEALNITDMRTKCLEEFLCDI